MSCHVLFREDSNTEKTDGLDVWVCSDNKCIHNFGGEIAWKAPIRKTEKKIGI
jgi:hypothetical protein